MNSSTLVAHADWSKEASKRWLARAVLQEDGQYLALPPAPAGAATTLLYLLRAEAGPDDSVLLGVDFPIGLPLAYAKKAGVDDFVALLPRLGWGEWADFYNVAVLPRQIGLRRPFYPFRPGGTRRQHLLDGLRVETIDHLRRTCDLAHEGRGAAAPLFWTMGAQQVGKAAIAGWRDMLAPALRDGDMDLVIWPFAGPLDDLLRPGRVVVAETYPAEIYGHLGLAFAAGGKRTQPGRVAQAGALLAWAEDHEVRLDPTLAADIAEGFGPDPAGEDPFDATVGLLGMLNVVLGHRPAGAPDDERIRRIEGWILGQIK